MKKEKKNPLFKEPKRIKSINVAREDENDIKRFCIILVVIIVLVGIIYGVTELTKKNNSIDEITSGKIDYTTLSIGMLFNRPEKEYYVILYDIDNPDAILYSAMINNYNSKDDNIKLYYCDLGNLLNRKYYNVGSDNKSNPNATSIDELDLGDLTLIKIKNGEIIKYVENYDDINKLLN